jgi:hypothetical protein
MSYTTEPLRPILVYAFLGLGLGLLLACGAYARESHSMNPPYEEDLPSLLRDARERNRPYKAPSADELRLAFAAGRVLFRECLMPKRERADRLLLRAHLILLGTQLGGGPAVVVREAASQRRGSGLYIFRLGPVPRERVVQIPHSFFDRGTLELGVELAHAVRARALFVNTVHRYQGGGPPLPDDEGRSDAPADLAHQDLTFFQSFTGAALAVLPQPQVLQLHGFADGAVAECPQALVVVSPGAASAGAAEAAQVAARLAALLGADRVLLYPRDTRRFGARRNAQGRLVAEDGRASFLHLELSHTLRMRLLEDAALRRAFIAAVIGAQGGTQ